jgi:hypothetical protein
MTANQAVGNLRWAVAVACGAVAGLGLLGLGRWAWVAGLGSLGLGR